MAAQFHLEPGILAKSFDATLNVANDTNGTEFAIPSRLDTPKTFAWQSIFTQNAPSAVSLALQGTLDFTNWFDLDTSTATAGEAKTIVDRVVRGLRGRVVTITNHASGTKTTIQILMS